MHGPVNFKINYFIASFCVRQFVLLFFSVLYPSSLSPTPKNEP